METCKIDGCDRKIFVKARGWCSPHYKRWWRHGDPEGGAIYYQDESVEDRLSRKYRVTDDGCWEWTEGMTSTGYGTCAVGGSSVLAHRLAYETWVGPIPEGLFVCHSCDNPPCINPGHLWLGTGADNMRDMAVKGRRKGLLVGESVVTSKLKESDVVEIRKMWADGTTQVDLGRMYGVCQTTISKIVRRESWKHVS